MAGESCVVRIAADEGNYRYHHMLAGLNSTFEATSGGSSGRSRGVSMRSLSAAK